MTDTNEPTTAQQEGVVVTNLGEVDGFTSGTTIVHQGGELYGWRHHFNIHPIGGRSNYWVTPVDEDRKLFFQETVLDFPEATVRHLNEANTLISEHYRGKRIDIRTRGVFVHGTNSDDTTPTNTRFRRTQRRRTEVENWAIRNIHNGNFYQRWMWEQTMWSDPRVPHNLKFPAYLALVRSTLFAACVWKNTDDSNRWMTIQANMVDFDEFYGKFLVDTSAGINTTYNRMYAGTEFRRLVETNDTYSMASDDSNMLMRPQFHNWRVDFCTMSKPNFVSTGFPTQLPSIRTFGIL